MQQLCLLPLWRCIYLLLPVPLFYIQIVIPEQMWVFCWVFFPPSPRAHSSYMALTSCIFPPSLSSILLPRLGSSSPPILCPLLTHAFLLWLITHSAESFLKQTALCNLDWGKLANSSHIGRPHQAWHVTCMHASIRRPTCAFSSSFAVLLQPNGLNEWVSSVCDACAICLFLKCMPVFLDSSMKCWACFFKNKLNIMEPKAFRGHC